MRKSQQTEKKSNDNDDSIFASDEDEITYDRKMRELSISNLEKKMNNIGFREGAGVAVDAYRQKGFEEGLIKGIKEGIEAGYCTGKEKASQLLQSLSVEK
jgi:flagellar biosynthesis/type III secretory pathway protein FliH